MRDQRDRADPADPLAEPFAQLLAAVDRRVDDDAAGIGLVGVEAGLPHLAQPTDDLVVVLLGRQHVGEAARRLDAALRTVEVGPRQECRQRAVLSRPAGVEALGHGAEHLAQPRRLRRRQAERPAHLLPVEPEQLADRRRGTENAGRAGDVPAAVVMVRIDCVGDAALDLDAGDQSGQEVTCR